MKLWLRLMISININEPSNRAFMNSILIAECPHLCTDPRRRLFSSRRRHRPSAPRSAACPLPISDRSPDSRHGLSFLFFTTRNSGLLETSTFLSMNSIEHRSFQKQQQKMLDDPQFYSSRVE